MSRARRRGRGGASSAPPPRRGEPSAPRLRRLPRAAAAAVALLALAGAALVLRGRSGGTAPAPSRKLPDDLLLITLDTTRADHLGCYGWARARTPHLDRLAAEGVRFAKAFSSAPITLPSHASIFTGLYPPAHGVRNNGNFYLSDRFETLATTLHARGYRTAAFVSSFILDRRYGLARGFDAYDDRMEGPQAQVVTLEAERRGDRTALALDRWLEQIAAAPGAPFFAWLHLYDPHEPYSPPRPFRELFADAPYDGEIAFDDAIVASVLDKLGGLGVLDRTLVAIVGDHGESLGDHGEETHSMLVYEPALQVPFILWRPGTVPSGRVVDEPVRTIDLAPTLLDLLGSPPLPRTDGRSLVGLIEGRHSGSPPPVYAETFLPQFYMNWSPLRAIRDVRYKLIEAPRPELYDLERDPGETANLYGQRPDTASALERELAAVTGGTTGSMNVAALDREAMEKLAALGYVGAGAEPHAGDARSQVDPKDMIAVFNRLRRANSAVRDRRFGDALPILAQVLRDDPRNAFARLVLGSAHMGMGDFAGAVPWFRKYLEIVPTSAYAHFWMAVCYVNMSDRDDALREAEATLAIDPRFSDARVLRAGVLATRGAYDQAVAEMRQAVATDPAKPMIRLDLARILGEAGRTEDARQEYEAILKIQADYAPALVGRGALEASAGNLDAAVADFRRALVADPGRHEARFDLAEALARQGRSKDAREEYRRVIEAPTAPTALRDRARERLAAMR